MLIRFSKMFPCSVKCNIHQIQQKSFMTPTVRQNNVSVSPRRRSFMPNKPPYHFMIINHGDNSPQTAQTSLGCTQSSIFQSPWLQSSIRLSLPLQQSNLAHLLQNNLSAIPHTIFSDAFSWLKSFVFWSKLQWNLSPNKPSLVQVMAWRRTGDKNMTWTKAASVHGGINAALGGIELIGWGLNIAVTSYERHGVTDQRQLVFFKILLRLTAKNRWQLCITDTLWEKSTSERSMHRLGCSDLGTRIVIHLASKIFNSFIGHENSCSRMRNNHYNIDSQLTCYEFQLKFNNHTDVQFI